MCVGMRRGWGWGGEGGEGGGKGEVGEGREEEGEGEGERNWFLGNPRTYTHDKFDYFYPIYLSHVNLVIGPARRT